MKLVISEYLRSLRERDELDRLMPDLLVEMGYTPIARPQTGNRQFGVDLAARGLNAVTKKNELLLLVIKQGDIGRTEWDTGTQAVRQSLNEIFDSFLVSHVENEDQGKPIRIAVVTSGEMKQTIQSNWSGFVNSNVHRAQIEFWGADRLSELIEEHLLDEHIFRDEDRRDLRRALALCADVDYDQRDFHRLLLRSLGLKNDGTLIENATTGKLLLKAVRIVNLATQAFFHWAIEDGDARQGLRASERVLLWTWHRIQLLDKQSQTTAIAEAFGSLWLSYLTNGKRYFEKIQAHCYAEDGISGYCSDGAEFSLVAFEQIGILATLGLSQVLFVTHDPLVKKTHEENADVVADALAQLVANNGICSSPCLDRHSQDITLALTLLIFTNRIDEAIGWIKKLVRNIDYAFKSERYVPIANDSLDDLVDEGGWNEGNTDARLMKMSWMLPTLAGWCALLNIDEGYEVIQRGAAKIYSQTCLQLWHPDKRIYEMLYFKQAQFERGATEAPIRLPVTASDWREHMRIIVDSNQAELANDSLALKSGVPAIDLIANRHFQTPIAPYFWYRFAEVMQSKNTDVATTETISA
jgi:hypothetical protein